VSQTLQLNFKCKY